MEKSFIEALSNAQLIDLQDGSALQLPDSQEVIAVGLTVDDRLSIAIDAIDNDLVLTLCHVQRKEDGHWFIPTAFLPCLLNDAPAGGECLLSQGSTISVGDREVRYSIPLESRLRMATVSKQSNGPPPKPRRTSLNLDAPPQGMPIMSPIAEEESDLQLSQRATDSDLIKHLSSPQEVAQLACSYVCHQVALYTDLLLSSEELDFLFKAILAAGETCQEELNQFVMRYNEEQEKQNENSGEIWPLHGPVIYLLKELLTENMDSVKCATMWIKLLATFANFSPNLASLIHHQVAPSVLGAMAVHSQATALQQYACTVLTQLATYAPPVGQKGPVREGGVDLILFAMTNHEHETLVLRPALRTLANLTNTYSSVANEAMNLGTYQSDEEGQLFTGLSDETHSIVLQEVERSMGILDFIEERALPVVMERMEHHLRDVAIQTEGRRLLAFFVDEEIQATRKRSVDMMTRNKPKVRFQLDPNDPSWIVSTDHDSLASSSENSDDEDDPSRRMSTVSMLSLGSAPAVGRLKLDADEDGNYYDLPAPVIYDDTQPTRRKPGVGNSSDTTNQARGRSHKTESVFEFEPWDDAQPVLRSSASIGVRKMVNEEVAEEDVSEPRRDSITHRLSVTFAPEVVQNENEEVYDFEESVDLTAMAAAGTAIVTVGEKSLMDELAEVKPDPVADGDDSQIYAEIDMEFEHVEALVETLSNGGEITSHSGGAAGESEPVYASVAKKAKIKQSEKNGKTSVETYTDYEEIPDLPERLENNKDVESKPPSLKRGVKNFLKTGRIFSKMKQKLRFKELRFKEEELLESTKENKLAENTPENYSEVNHVAEACVITGVTTDETGTDDALVSNRKSNVVSPVNSQEGTKAPPLFVEPEEPQVKGSRNAIGNLIDKWKNKENKPDSPQSGAKKKKPRVAARKHWRPFEKDNDAKFDEKPMSGTEESNGTNVEDQDPHQFSASTSDKERSSQPRTEQKDIQPSTSKRRTLGSLAMLPDVERFLTSTRPSITDAAELATWTSAYNSMSVDDAEDIDLEAEQAVRINRTKWKSVVAEMKDKIKGNGFALRSTRQTADNVSKDDVNSQGGEKQPIRRVSNEENRQASFPELRKPEYLESNILAAKALIAYRVVNMWHMSPSLAATVLAERASECLSASEVAPDIIFSIRDDFNLDLPINKGHLEWSSTLMDILIGRPSGDETRMELLDSLLDLLSVSAHPYHHQVAAQCGWALLTDSLSDLTVYPTGGALLQELLEATGRRLHENHSVSIGKSYRHALTTFMDRINVWLQREVWL